MPAPNFPGGMSNFSPCFGATEAISVTTATNSATFSAGEFENNDQMLLYNAGASLAFVRWGTGAQTALTTDFPLPPGAAMVVFKGPANTVAAITASGTATVYAQPGIGQ